MTIASTLSDGGADKEREPSPLPSRTPVDVERKEGPVRALSEPEVTELPVSADDGRAVVSRYLGFCTKDKPLPPLIAGFLATHWRTYMANLYAGEGEQSEAWSIALQNTVKLVWSVQPKPDDRSRQRLYKLIPELFSWVHQVLDAQVSVAEEDRFFAELAKLHAAALNTNARAPSGGTRVDGQKSRQGPEARESPRAPQAVADEVRPPGDSVPETPAEPPEPAHDTKPVADSQSRLAVGSWVEFQGERATRRVLRLEWISKGGGVYHFRDQKRDDSLCLTAARFAQLMQENAVSILK